MRVIQNKWIPFKGYKYINLFGLIFTRDASKINAKESREDSFEVDARDAMVTILLMVWNRVLYYQTTQIL